MCLCFLFLVIKRFIIVNKYKKLIKIAYNNYYASLLRALLKVPKYYTKNTCAYCISNCFKKNDDSYRTNSPIGYFQGSYARYAE